MLSLHAGYDVAYLTDAVGRVGTDYYLSAAEGGGEPPGFWAGKGAKALSLEGQVDAQVMRNLHHRSIGPDGAPLEMSNRAHTYGAASATLAERTEAEIQAKIAELGEFATEREIAEIRLTVAAKQSSNVPFFDFTLSMAKSISVTHASYIAAAKQAHEDGDQAEVLRCMRQADAIEEAVREGARQVVRSAERHAAYIRTGHHGGGQGQWRDAAGLTAAIFVQHTSRDGDPQLHAHIAILNRAQRADGEDTKWRTLDSRSLHRERLGIAARAGMVVEQRLLAARFSLVQREDGNGREIEGVSPATMRAFSSRRAAITPAIKRLADEYEAAHGHAPSRRALWSLRQWATVETRKSKHEVQRTAAEDLAAWEAQSAAAEVQILADVRVAVQEFGEAHEVASPCTADLHRGVRIAVHEVQRQNATWTASQLAWELFRAMPPRDAGTSTVELLQSMLTDALLGRVPEVEIVPLSPAPDVTDVSVLGVRDSDGVSVYRPPGEARYCTADMLDTEEFLIQSARRRVQQAVTDDEAAAAAAGLAGNQADVLRGLLTSKTAVTVLVGPAGTGKTYVMARFAEAWIQATGREVIGLTASTNAARQLALEGMSRTYNIAQFLGKLPDTDRTRGHVPVHAGDVLVVDEASQVSTADLLAIQVIASRVGARVILTGDTAQLPAVEAGGIMAEIATQQGHWKLQEVHRFTTSWEARASLAMRAGDIKAWMDYEVHGRIRHGPQNVTYAKAVELWVTDHLQGKESLLLAGSNAEAADLARLARAKLAEYGVIQAGAEITLADGNEAGTEDLVRARLNTTIEACGQPLTNRDTLRITGWSGRGQERAAIAERQTRDGWSAPFEVPVAYLAESAELAYAGNVFVAQGRTVRTGHLIVSPTLTRESLYTGMTRGWEENTAHVVTGPPPGLSPQEQAPPEAVIRAAMEREDAAVTATQTIRDAQAWATNSRHLFELWRALVHHETSPAVDAALQARLPEAEYQRYLTDPQRPVLHRQLREAQLAGHDVTEILDRVTQQSYEGARSIAAVLHGRVEKLGLEPGGKTTTWAERTPGLGGQSPPASEWRRDLEEAVAALDHRQLELGMAQLEKPEPWAVRYLGMPPKDPGPLRDDWMARIGQVASYREAAGHTDPEQAIGPYPGQNPELAEAYKASVRALEMQQEETVRSMPRGGLERRVETARQAQAWAPKPVDRDLMLAARAEKDAAVQAEAARQQARPVLAASAEALRARMAAERERLEIAQAARCEWEEANAAKLESAREAKAELARRGVRDEAAPEPAPEPEREPEPVAEAPEPARDEPVPESEPEPAAREPGPPQRDEAGQDLERARVQAQQQREADQAARQAEAERYETERAMAAWQEPEVRQREAEAESELEM
jgi:conjugative relaxase-like TrwC/TraI family protein